MLPNIYIKAKNRIITELNINNDSVDNILKNIRTREKKSLVYVDVIENIGTISRKQTLLLLTILVDENILEIVYKLYCKECRILQHEIFENISDALESGICEECGFEATGDSVILMFRKHR